MHNHPIHKHGGYWHNDQYYRGVVVDPYNAYYDPSLCATWPWFCGVGDATAVAVAASDNDDDYDYDDDDDNNDE